LSRADSETHIDYFKRVVKARVDIQAASKAAAAKAIDAATADAAAKAAMAALAVPAR